LELLSATILSYRSDQQSPTPALAEPLPVVHATAEPSAPPAQEEPQPDEPQDDGRTRVVLDPGHGGVDPGAVRGSIHEAKLNLSLAFRVKEYLEDLGYHVLLTREDDSTVSRPDRAVFAQEAKAHAFVSIHHNAFGDSVTNGIETWYNDRMNAQNRSLSRDVQNELVAATKARNRGLRVTRDLMLLRQDTLDMPACLVEVGFLSSDRERALLIRPDYQDKLAVGIAAGIDKFLTR